MSEDAAAAVAIGARRRAWLAIGLAVVIAVVVVVVWQRGGSAPTSVDRIELESGALSGWNVLLVSMDTVRSDRIHCYGREEIDTPVVDGLARRGILFQQAVACVPMTLPSHATMLTGLDAPHHGARVNGMFRLDEKVTTLGEILRKHGYRTSATIGAFVLDRRAGLDRGFDVYDDDMSAGQSSFKFSYRERRADQVNEVATAWLRKNAGQRFFMFVHYFDPHWPFNAPEPFASRYTENDDGDYDAEIAYTDDQLGKLLDVLDELDVRDRTLVIVVSDHGEGLGDHDEPTHSLLLYDATLRVPLVFSGPSPLPGNRLVERQVGLVDLMPTILDLLGIEIPPGLDGVSLLEPPAPGPRTIYIETLAPYFLHGWAPLVGIRRPDFKFVFAPKPELYDLRSDPRELKDLFEKDRATASAMYDELKQIVGGDPELVGRVTANLPVDEETRRKLADLGYVVASSAPATSGPASQPKVLPDPKDMILAQRWVVQAQTLVQNAQNAEALLLLERYLKDHPDDAVALHVAGECYRNVGEFDRSLEVFRRASRQSYDKAAAFTGMGIAYMYKKDMTKAEAAIRRALELDPRCANALMTLGMIRTRQKRDTEALSLYKQVLKEGRGIHDANARVAIAQVYNKEGKKDLARAELEKALESNPNHPGALSLLNSMAETDESRDTAIAQLREALKTRRIPRLLLQLGKYEIEKGQYAQAAKTLREAVELQSGSDEIHYQLSRALQNLGAEDKALQHLRRAVQLAPLRPDVLTDLGLILARRNRLKEAREYLARAAAAAPRQLTYRYNLGIILAKLQELPDAEREFREVLKLDPEYAHAHYNLAVVLRLQGRTAEAGKHFRRAAELDPKLGKAASGPNAAGK